MAKSSIGRTTEIAEYLFDFRKDIELFGMYGACNIGDEAMKDAGLAILPEGRTIPVIGNTRLPLVRSMIGRKIRSHLVVGGGTLIHGGVQSTGSNGWLDTVERFSQAGSHIAFMGTGISFLPDQITGKTDSVVRWAAILNKADYVGVRGPLSQGLAAQIGAKADIFGDAAFSLHRAGRADAPRDKGRIGFNFGECLGDQDHYEAVNAALLQAAATDFHCAIFVVRPSDRISTRRIIDRSAISADRYTVIEITDDVAHFMESVSGLHALVAVKLHAAGLAMVAGVPSLLFEYQKKCRDFMMPIDMEHALIPMSADSAGACRHLEALLAKPDHYRNDKAIGEMAKRQRKIARDYFERFPRR